MIKVNFNSSNSNIDVISLDYSTVYSVDNYSTRSDSIGMSIPLSELDTLMSLENTEIETMKVMDAEANEITTINFTTPLFILNSNTSIYDANSTNVRVNLGQVSVNA